MSALLLSLDALILLAFATAVAVPAASVFLWLKNQPAREALRKERRKRHGARLRRQVERTRELPQDQDLRAAIAARNLRRSDREPTFLRARVRSADDAPWIECTVLDLSASGAQLAFGHEVDLPPVIEVDLAKHGRRMQARVAWATPTRCGIQFSEEPSSAVRSHPGTRAG